MSQPLSQPIADRPASLSIADRPASLPIASQRRKAAMVVQLLLADGQKLALSSLPEDQQVALARELGSLRMIDRRSLELVALEFAAELQDVALAAPGTVDGALSALSGQISPGSVTRIREEEARRKGSDPWAQILVLTPQEIVPLLERESLEVGAVTLSKLPVSKAAAVLGLLSGEKARRITYAMGQTAAVTPDAVKLIGASLATEYGSRPAAAFSSPPSQRVGAILNSSQSSTRDSVMDALLADDPDFAELVRKAIFTFPDIPHRVQSTDVSKFIRGVDNDTLVLALASALADGGLAAETVEFIFANMSQRMADQLREEVREKGKIKKSDGEAAQSEVINVIRTQADSGEITLIVADDEDED